MEEDKGKIKKKIDPYMKYAGLGTQMAVMFFIGIWGGKKLDAYFNFEKPILTITLIFVLFTGFMYKLYKELS